jgi:cullin 1
MGSTRDAKSLALQTMKHQHLINEVSQLVSKSFPPVVSAIKKTIEHLVDQDYLERADGANDT